METKVNRRVYAEDLKTDMWVWNETQQEYQKVRYVCVSKLGKYHWCDGWGNVIENDELYLYQKGDN